MKQRTFGFTIIELTVVIVVIGILAGIVTVGYSGYKRNLAESAVRSDLSHVASSIKASTLDKDSEGFSKELPVEFQSSDGVDLILTSATFSTFCVTGASSDYGDILWHISNTDSSPVEGACPGYPNLSTGFTAAAAGYKHSCGIFTGRVYCWGDGTNGKLGNGTNATSSTPVQVRTTSGMKIKDVTVLSVGYTHACAIAGGSVYCWGQNGLGNGQVTTSNVPIAVKVDGVLSGKTVTALSTGMYTTCAVADGQGYCWDSSGVPTAFDTSGVTTGKTVTAVAADQFGHSCLVADGKAYCKGSNTYGQLGDASTTTSSTLVAVDTSGVLSGKTVTSIVVGMYHTCVIASGQPYCWGQNSYGQLGNNTTSGTSANSSPVAVTTSGVLSGKTMTSITAYYHFNCGIADAKAYCWGISSNTNGNLGDGNGTNSSVPVAVSTAGAMSGKNIVSIGAGFYNVCAADGVDAYCWGWGSYGQLGNGTTPSASYVPVLVTSP